ncbi:MAG: hypothetical protein LBP40_02650 [Campylobacteraceae bacterium]|jgi:hypothetical protein|nr:hypothetical protein [Campylobacteraceae bacterium]
MPNNKLLLSLTNTLNQFNLQNQISLNIDTLRITFSRQYKLDSLKAIGEWVKLKKIDELYHKAIKRHTTKELSSAYRLKDEDIFYFNLSDYPKYRKSMLVIFGITQPHKEPNHQLIDKLISLFKTITSIDICYDTPYKPNLANLEKHYRITRYKDTDTYYVNDTGYPMLDRIVIYNKQSKNKLASPLFRIEATMSVNPKYLSLLPLDEFKLFLEHMDIKPFTQLDYVKQNRNSFYQSQKHINAYREAKGEITNTKPPVIPLS